MTETITEFGLPQLDQDVPIPAIATFSITVTSVTAGSEQTTQQNYSNWVDADSFYLDAIDEANAVVHATVNAASTVVEADVQAEFNSSNSTVDITVGNRDAGDGDITVDITVIQL